MPPFAEAPGLRATRPLLSWWLLVGEATAIGSLGLLVGTLMFSLLPVSTAVITMLAATIAFPLARHRLTARGHFLVVCVVWLVLSILFLLLIESLGRQHFEWLLDWT